MLVRHLANNIAQKQGPEAASTIQYRNANTLEFHSVIEQHFIYDASITRINCDVALR
jgi:hypothetical protein